jgi:hypothetical protein
LVKAGSRRPASLLKACRRELKRPSFIILIEFPTHPDLALGSLEVAANYSSLMFRKAISQNGMASYKNSGQMIDGHPDR